MPESFSHINQRGDAHMVDVSNKQLTMRQASAESLVLMNTKTLDMIIEGKHHKGDVFATARIAGIQAAKKTWIRIQANCQLNGQTGVEMEAMVAASVAALTIYDMCKAVQKDMVITQVRLLTKSGGKSGDFIAKEINE